jgi:hypothetical protein
LKALFEQIAIPSKLGALGLMPVLDRTAKALDRVNQIEFFKTFDTGAAVQHFYEPFLHGGGRSQIRHFLHFRSGRIGRRQSVLPARGWQRDSA